MRERGCSPTTTPAQLRRPYRSRHPYAVSKTSLQCVCIQRRNCIEQLSPSPKYAPGNAHFPVGTMPQSSALSEMTPRPSGIRRARSWASAPTESGMADRDSDQRADCEAGAGASEARSRRLTEAGRQQGKTRQNGSPTDVACTNRRAASRRITGRTACFTVFQTAKPSQLRADRAASNPRPPRISLIRPRAAAPGLHPSLQPCR